jgi:hypothetical protein
VHHRLPVRAALTASFYAAPQEPVDSRRLFDAAVADAGYDRPVRTPLPANRVVLAALLLAREWGIADLDDRLGAAVEESYEPAWDSTRGEFTWGFGLGEEHPRGQYNAFLAAAEACGVGSWARLAAAPITPCPQVVGVDFPAIAFRRAEWVHGSLHLRMAPLQELRSRRTSFDVTGIARADLDQATWSVSGVENASVEVIGDRLRVTAPLVAADLGVQRSS